MADALQKAVRAMLAAGQDSRCTALVALNMINEV
jgi:hypothetical protein